MGASLTRNRSRGEESGEISSQSNSYRYPPKNGCYFGTHFIMGGERFESPQPGEYLFGDSEELNFLGNKPIPFPYPVPSGNEPTKTLKSLVYIRKDSLRLVKAERKSGTGDSNTTGSAYNVEFTFDCDVRCAIQIHYFSSEEVINGLVVYHPMDSSLSSEVFHYKRGAGQVFSQPVHTLDPTKYSEEDKCAQSRVDEGWHIITQWQCNFEKEIYPIVIHCSVEEEDHTGHSHITYAVLERNQEGVYAIKPLKQKQVVDGLCYLLQEIYGIENKTMERMKDVDPDDEVEDSGAECVICMSDMRDTLILPCRHLCLCSSCADSLRYQASMCPICRVKFRALLQVRAMRKKTAVGNTPHSEPEDNPVNQEGVPTGYEAISLIEALNGQVVPPVNSEGVHLQISSGPPAVFSLDKKGHKDNKIMVQCPIEYQKEMDTDKESNKGTLEKKDKENTTTVDSTDVQSDATPDEVVVSRPVMKDVPQPFKSTVVTVRHSPDGSITTETKISPVLQNEIVVAPNASPSPRTAERGQFKTNINISRLACGLSTGDMADDEREDSSEPEPDYDEHDSDDLVTMTSTSQPDLSMSASGSLSNIAMSPGPVQAESYDPLQVQVANLTDAHNSGTEASSFGSNSSSHALLTPSEQQVSNNASGLADNVQSEKEGEPIV